MLLMSNCCECGGRACLLHDQFNGMSPEYGWHAYNFDGTQNGTGYVFDPISATVKAGDSTTPGNGSLTVKSELDTAALWIEAQLIDTSGWGVGSSESGVTIRRADSVDRISLVRQWSDPNNYILRSGDTVLKEFPRTGAGDGRKIKLQLSDVDAATVAVSCYVDDILEHAEPGVTWDNPAVLHVGVICWNGGEWESLMANVCQAASCKPESICESMALVPHSWTMTVDPGNHTDGSHPCGVDECELLGGTFTLIPYRQCAAKINDQEIGDPPRPWSLVDVLQSNEGDSQRCTWYAVRPIPVPASQAMPFPEQYPYQTLFPAQSGSITYNDDLDTGEGWCVDSTPNCIGYEWPALLQAFPFGGGYLAIPENIIWTMGQEFRIAGVDNHFEYRFRLVGFLAIWTSCNEGEALTHAYRVLYTSDWFTEVPLLDFRDTPLTVSRNIAESPSWDGGTCAWPDSLELIPDANTDEAKLVAGCTETCDPPLTPGENYALTTSDGTDDGIGCSIASGIFNETTFSWEWSWNIFVQYTDPMTGNPVPPPYGCGVSAGLNFTANLTCYEKNEGEGKKWWLDFSGDVTGSMEWDVESDITSGEVDICGTADVPFGAMAGQCTVEDHPLYACAAEESRYLLCCLEDVSIHWIGNCCSFGNAYEKTIIGGSFSDAEPGVIRVAWPFAYPPEAHEVKIECNGSATVLDENGDPVSPNPIDSFTWDSASISGEIEVKGNIFCVDEYSYKIQADWGSGSALLVFSGGIWRKVVPINESLGTMACPGNTWPVREVTLTCDPMSGKWTLGLFDGQGHVETYRAASSGLPSSLPVVVSGCSNSVSLTMVE